MRSQSSQVNRCCLKVTNSRIPTPERQPLSAQCGRSAHEVVHVCSIGHWWKANCLGQRTTTEAACYQLQQKVVALSSRRQDLIDQPIVRCFERIDKSNSRQFR